MADPKDTNAGGEAGSMTLAQVVETLGQIAPQVAALTAAMAKLGTPAPATAAATPDGAVPPAAKPAATPVEAAGATAGMTEDKLAAAMDGALKPIRDELARLGGVLAAVPAAVATDSAARDKLADRLAAHIGTFDAKDKTLQAVAVYGAEKLGLKPPAGSELVAVDAYLTAADKLAKPATVTTGAGLDAATGSAPAFVTRHLSGAAVK